MSNLGSWQVQRTYRTDRHGGTDDHGGWPMGSVEVDSRLRTYRAHTCKKYEEQRTQIFYDLKMERFLWKISPYLLIRTYVWVVIKKKYLECHLLRCCNHRHWVPHHSATKCWSVCILYIPGMQHGVQILIYSLPLSKWPMLETSRLRS